LCGKIDWLTYSPDSDTVEIIDFKTGKHEEDSASLQLPIYHLLVANCQKRRATRACYWYLDQSDEPVEKPLPNLDEAKQKVLQIAKEMRLARKLNLFKCSSGNGCQHCQPFETIVRGEAEFVGTNDYNADVFILPFGDKDDGGDSVVL
jgi:RecB family exonuclease